MRVLPVVVLWIGVSGCGISTYVQLPQGPSGPPVTQTGETSDTFALTGTPYVPVLSGHRLALSGDIAIVSDPEGPNEDGTRPQLHFASISQHVLLGAIDLPSGTNPQAIAAGDDGYAYVVLEGVGGVIAVDVVNRKLGAFSATCPAPADLAVNGHDVLVACRTGEVVKLSPEGKTVTQVKPGLARIAVDAQGHVLVATASAEILEVGSSAPGVTPGVVKLGDAVRVEHGNTPQRLLPLPSGGVVMAYQQSLSGELTDETGPVAYYGGGTSSCPMPATRPAAVGYDVNSGFGGQQWVPAALVVDAALTPSGNYLVEADAAGGALRLQMLALLEPQAGGASADGRQLPDTECTALGSVFGEKESPAIDAEMPTGVAYAGDTLVVLNASPALELLMLPAGEETLTAGTGLAGAQHVALRTRTLSEGFKIFHSDPKRLPGQAGNTPQTLACASCHPNGLSNGATTTIQGTTHRVMPLAGHLATANLMHWSGGTFHDAVAESTWHNGMSGDELTPSQETSLRAFVGQLRPPARPVASAADLAAGQAAFSQAGCDQCHVPSTAYTNDQTRDVGKGLHKVPSLVGLFYTAPYMSDGCAATLEQRFDDPACGGGAQHGNVAALSTAERAALITFLKTL